MGIDVHHQSAGLVKWHIVEVEEVGLPVALHVLRSIGGDTRCGIVCLTL